MTFGQQYDYVLWCIYIHMFFSEFPQKAYILFFPLFLITYCIDADYALLIDT